MDNAPKEENMPAGAKNASGGAIVTIIIILAMIVLGAFYTLHKRIIEQRAANEPVSTSTPTQNP